MLNAETKKIINSARDVLVGKIPDPKAQVEQITFAMFYKFMDEKDNEAVALGGKKQFFTGEFENFSWSKLMDARLGGTERMDLYTQALAKMSQNPHIAQLFRDIYKDAFIPFRSPETLSLFLKEIDQLDYTNTESLGDAFEYLLSVMGSQGDAGQFRTPRHIIDFIVDVVDPQKSDSILDPACGTAGFLISSYKHIVKQHDGKDDPEDKETPLTPDEKKNLMKNLMGYDISPDMVRLSKVNLYLHGLPNPTIYEYDTLSSEEKWDENFDVILANPPFMSPKGGIKPHKRFSIQANRAEVLFVDYIIEHLKPNGRAGIIVPEGIIFQSSNAYKELRKKLIEENYLWSVVSLPTGVFNPYSGVKTSILLIDKEIAKKSDSIVFMKISNDGFDLGAQRKEINNSDLPIAKILLDSYKKNILSGNTPKTDELETLSENTISIFVKKSKIKELGDYYLSGDRYKEINVNINQKWPMIELAQVLEYEQPTKYIVNSVNYSNTNKTPVLTAGKTFILGYTDETTGIYNKNLPVIIFDDFTTATKLVNFPFKVKSSAMKILCVKKELANIKYLYYVMQNIKFSSSTHKRYWISEYSKIKVPLPPLEIQNEIVQEIENYQKIIDGAKQVVDNWKPKINIDSGWKYVKIGEVAKVRGGFAFKSQDMAEKKGIQIIKIGNVKNQQFDYKNNPSFIKEKLYNNYADYQLKINDILISMTGTAGKRDYGNVCMVDSLGKFLLNQRVGRIIPNSKVIREYLFIALNQSETKDNFYSNATGGVRQGNISNKQIELIKIPLPTLEIQKQIVERINREREIVYANKALIDIFEQNIKNVIIKLWNE